MEPTGDFGDTLCRDGKERKYTGLTKLKIIENLLKLVSEKNLQGHENSLNPGSQSSSAVGQRASKRQRKTDHPNRLLVTGNSIVSVNNDGENVNVVAIYCKNSACRAKLSQVDKFCKRCSCCICHQYDDNKDPSLWLTCSSEPPFQGNSCGMSCHLECALKNEKSGIAKQAMDGSFSCVSCGKVNDLLGCWRKQMMTAKDTRRVDILCYRVSLGQRLLSGTRSYQKLYEIVDEAVKKLEVDVGPLTGLPVRMARGIVNRLPSGPEVQRLCASAVESLDSMLSKVICHLPESNSTTSNIILFQDVCASSLTVILGSEDPQLENILGYTLWHRKAEDIDYPAEPTCTLFKPNKTFLLSGLNPATEYVFKVVYFDSTGELGTCEVHLQTNSPINEAPPAKELVVERSESPGSNYSSLSNPSSVEDENNNIASCSKKNENGEDNGHSYCKSIEKFVPANLSNEAPGDSVSLLEVGVATGTSGEAGLPITPCKLENNTKDGVGRSGRFKPSNKDLIVGLGEKRSPMLEARQRRECVERRDEENSGNESRDFEYYVKVVRWLECQGHIEKTFRQKFLTWYSLRATQQEMRVVKVFVDTLIEDPASLAGQLVDTFSEAISSKRSSVVPSGFCLKLWH
ncbi:unnamed protein product [Thlaspi arvense]|uniref:Fibronectin type-III domain-containing protein n=1 Tax=Thlaspi arvense TaxID=13288 RepID=A0AAU9S4H5_THLAR|nr:unnamed protein product [Thlaspi arvense]